MKSSNANASSGFPVDLNDPVQLRYLNAMIHREFPWTTAREFSAAVEGCGRDAAPAQSRAELTECVRVHPERLKGGR